MTATTFDYRTSWKAIREFKATDDPTAAAAHQNAMDAARAYNFSREALDKAKRSRAADKEQRIADAQTVFDITSANLTAAQEALAEASREPEERNHQALKSLALGLAIDALNDVEHSDVALSVGSIRFVNTYPTGRMVKRLYDSEEYEEIESRLEEGYDDNTIAVEKGDCRIKFDMGWRGDFTFTVQALDNDTVVASEARGYRFGYEAKVSLERYDGWRVRVGWGSFSGMTTLADVQTTIDVHRVALALGQVIDFSLLHGEEVEA